MQIWTWDLNKNTTHPQWKCADYFWRLFLFPWLLINRMSLKFCDSIFNCLDKNCTVGVWELSISCSGVVLPSLHNCCGTHVCMYAYSIFTLGCFLLMVFMVHKWVLFCSNTPNRGCPFLPPCSSRHRWASCNHMEPLLVGPIQVTTPCRYPTPVVLHLLGHKGQVELFQSRHATGKCCLWLIPTQERISLKKSLNPQQQRRWTKMHRKSK